MTLSARVLRGAAAGVLALGLAGATGFAGAPAARGAALPHPRSEEWWFTSWDIQNKVWPLTQGQGITVAVVDTGVNARLPELKNVVLRGTDLRHGHSGDGRTDVKNYNLELGPHSSRFVGHGTGMASLIAGQGGPSGMVGIAPKAKILPIIIDGFVSTLSAGIRYAADHGAQVINLSQATPYPGGCPGLMQAAVSHAIDKGAVVVASMGNFGNTTNPIDAPASCAGVLAVGAISNQKLAWTRTERHSYVSAAAPGVGVGFLTREGWFDNHTSGTSQASALTSGAVALIRSRFPELTPRQVVQKIINTTVDAGPRGHDIYTGSGAVVPIFALTRNVPKNAPNPTFHRLDQWRAQNPFLAYPSKARAAETPASRAENHPDSSPGISIGVILAVVAALAAVVAVVVVLATRRRGGPRPAPQGRHPGGQLPYQAPPAQYGGPQGPGGQPGPFGPPPDQGAPSSR